MDVKRRDNKGRILRDRESQRKDGKYRFSYIKNGKRADIYSWRLEPTDKLPKGKRNGPALRTMEAEILKQELLGETAKPSMDVLTLVKRYLKTKRGVRETTKTGYQTVLNFLEKEEFARYAQSYTSCLQAYLLYQYGKIRNKRKESSILNGSCRYCCNL